MNSRVILALLMIGFGVSAAQADTLYKCIDMSGVVLYTNQKTGAKSCTVLSSDQPISTVASPKRAPRTATPGDFPRINGDTQRSRDGDRRKILEQELVTERQNLGKARKALVEVEATRLGDEKSYQKYLDRAPSLKDSATVHERNVEALTRELANLK